MTGPANLPGPRLSVSVITCFCSCCDKTSANHITLNQVRSHCSEQCSTMTCDMPDVASTMGVSSYLDCSRIFWSAPHHPHPSGSSCSKTELCQEKNPNNIWNYCIIPLCQVTFCIHSGIIPVGQFSRKCAKSINQSSVDLHCKPL